MDEGYINQNTTKDKHGDIEVLYRGVVNYRCQHKENCCDDDQDGDYNGNLVEQTKTMVRSQEGWAADGTIWVITLLETNVQMETHLYQ